MGSRLKAHAALLALLGLLLLAVGGRAQNTANEFVIYANNFDTLRDHSRNCTVEVDFSVGVIFCEDGYFAMDRRDTLLNPDTAFNVAANITFDLQGTPKDLRLDKFLSIVDDRGDKLTIIKKSTLQSLQIELNREGNDDAQLLGGFFSPDFVVFLIADDGESFLQVHTSAKELDLVGAVEGNIINYEVLDLAQERDVFYVYATQQVTATLRELVVLQIPFDAEQESWAPAAMRTLSLDPLQCSDRLKVSKSIIVQACLSTKTITVTRRKTNGVLLQRTFT